MKILITGGAGYKGVKLAESLLNDNHEITILDNFMYGYDSILSIINNKNLFINKKDIRNIEKKDIAEFDFIFHLAGISGMPACALNPHSAEDINTNATAKLIKLLDKEQKLINASTTSVYGDIGNICDENSIVTPLSIYSKTKYEAEKIVQERSNSISLRFATVFGTSYRMRNDLMVNDFVYKAMHERHIILFASGTKRTFIHISDAINAYKFAMNNFNEMNNNVYNVGDENMNLSKMDVCNEISKYIMFEKINSSMKDLDNRNFEISFKKIKNKGFSITKNLEYGIQELIKLYQFYIQYTPYQII